MTPNRWTPGNRVELLENGEDFFPRLVELVDAANSHVYIETFIYFDDDVGSEIQQALIRAAQRGVNVYLTVDGYGTAFLPTEFIEAMTSVGIRYYVYRPSPMLFGFRTSLFRRLHQKIVVVDQRVALIGGINISKNHTRAFGPQSKQDYAVSVEGPLVNTILRYAHLTVARMARVTNQPAPAAIETQPAEPQAGGVDAAFLIRDNRRHPNDIEKAYLHAINAAKQRVVIANAYFFPGLRLRRALKKAAQRGVRVVLILQGKPDKGYARLAADSLYDYLMEAGVEIHEYAERPLHAKVALVDDDWATVGSSNLDPLSLFLNLECNVLIRDGAFNQVLDDNLRQLAIQHCVRVEHRVAPMRLPLRWLLTLVAYHLLRRFPARAGWVPAHISERRLASTQAHAQSQAVHSNT